MEITLKDIKFNKKAMVIAVLVAIAFSFAFWTWISPETLEKDMSINVGGNVGFDVNTTFITFGTVPQDGISIRGVIITNNDNYDKLARFSADGNISSFIQLPPDTLVKAHQNTTVNAEAVVPWGAKYGEYTGKFKILLTRAI